LEDFDLRTCSRRLVLDLGLSPVSSNIFREDDFFPSLRCSLSFFSSSSAILFSASRFLSFKAAAAALSVSSSSRFKRLDEERRLGETSSAFESCFALRSSPVPKSSPFALNRVAEDDLRFVEGRSAVSYSSFSSLLISSSRLFERRFARFFSRLVLSSFEISLSER
jgi:hypothetical protein